MALPNTTSTSLQHAIDNVHTLGDVGDMSEFRLYMILPHASTEQLLHIETCSKERNLTPITNPLWRRHFARRYGEDDANMLEMQTPKGGAALIWRSLYEEEVAQDKKLQGKGVERLRELIHRQNEVKASRKIQCIKMMAPQGSRKRAKTTTTFQPSPRLPSARPKEPKVEVESRGFVDMAPTIESRGLVAKKEKKIVDMTPRVQKYRLWKKSVKEHHDHLRLQHRLFDMPLELPREYDITNLTYEHGLSILPLRA